MMNECCTDKKMPQVVKELQELLKVQDALENRVGKLRERLSPILSTMPIMCKESDCSKTLPSLCPLAQEISDLIVKFDSTQRQLEDILERIEV